MRVAWVTAELAMARGDGVAAVGHAEQAVELAAKLGSARHTVKSDVILAAALCSAGELERSRPVADAALEATARLRLIPLRWALACLLSRHRQCNAFGGAGREYPWRVRRYSASWGRPVVRSLVIAAPSGSLVFS